MHKILLNTQLAEPGLSLLKENKNLYITQESLSEEELIQVIHNYHVLIISGRTRITKHLISNAPLLKLIARAGTGTDNIDTQEAHKHGIHIISAQESNTISTVEHTWALLLSLARKIPQAYESLRSGKWERSAFLGVELYGKTLGVIGFGRIGKEVGLRAQAFGMRLLVYDPHIPQHPNTSTLSFTTLQTLCQHSDIITIHTPLTKETQNLLTLQHFTMMKRSSLIINCARGGICNEKALKHALEHKLIAGAALDVFTTEPPDPTTLLSTEGLLYTPHIGAATAEAKHALSNEICRKVRDFLQVLPNT